jgi:predicted RNase H-like nuclease (RuvC/YqgF family)
MTDTKRARDKAATLKALTQAIAQMQKRNEKLTIAGVARGASVTPALIHNVYPDLAERIRGLAGKSTRAQRDTKHRALLDLRKANKDLRSENDALSADNRKLASLNLALASELEALKARSATNVVALPTGKPKAPSRPKPTGS